VVGWDEGVEAVFDQAGRRKEDGSVFEGFDCEMLAGCSDSFSAL
jgi:hypothetical protein